MPGEKLSGISNATTFPKARNQTNPKTLAFLGQKVNRTAYITKIHMHTTSAAVK